MKEANHQTAVQALSSAKRNDDLPEFLEGMSGPDLEMLAVSRSLTRAQLIEQERQFEANGGNRKKNKPYGSLPGLPVRIDPLAPENS